MSRTPAPRPTRTHGATQTKRKRAGVNPWLPNQHGAWAMLVMPLLVGFVLGFHYFRLSLVAHGGALLMVAIAVMWLFGYFTFFAFGLWFKTRNAQRKAEYVRPVLVYGAITAVAGICALFVEWRMVFWVPLFLPLVVWAFREVVRRHQRSLSSGVSTTVASTLMIPVMASAGFFVPPPLFFFVMPAQLIVATITVGLYFVGTIPYVKTMIREKGNPEYQRFSVRFHAIALCVVAALCLPMMLLRVYIPSGTIFILTMAWCLYRARSVPRQAAENPRAWTPKRVGMREVWPTIAIAVGCLAWVWT